jgi:hypothetical protein
VPLAVAFYGLLVLGAIKLVSMIAKAACDIASTV